MKFELEIITICMPSPVSQGRMKTLIMMNKRLRHCGGIGLTGYISEECKDMAMFYVYNVDSNVDEQEDKENKVQFEDDVSLQEAEQRVVREMNKQHMQRMWINWQINTTCLCCAVVGVGMRHSTPLTSLFEDVDDVKWWKTASLLQVSGLLTVGHLFM